MSGDLVSRKNRKTKNFQIAGPHIAIAAAPTPGMAMREELRLLKPALLYGDHVTLVSPKAAMIAGVLDIAKLNTEDFLRLIAEFAPIVSPGKHGGLDEGVKRYRELKRKRGRTPAELIQQLRFEQETRQMFESTMLPPLREIASETGAVDLVPAIEAGLLTVTPLSTTQRPTNLEHLFAPSQDDWSDNVVSGFVNQISELIDKPDTYPLFDNETSKLWSLGIKEGVFELPAGASHRAKEVHTAASFMERLPAFDKADVSEVLGIREELGEALVNFRAAVSKLGKLIEAAPREDHFGAKIEELYAQEISPALLEIHQRIRDNQYLLRLAGSAGPVAGVLGEGVLTAIVGQSIDSSQLIAGIPSDSASQLAALLGSGASLTAIAKWTVEQASEKAKESRQIQRQELYFLYRVNNLLD